MTVYRLVGGQRCAFPGPKVYWLETYACKKNGCPNTMWTDRPMGMIDKCAEAAALRGAFPEELGGEPSYEEWGGFRWHGRAAIDAPSESAPQLEAPAKSKPKAVQQAAQSDPPKPPVQETPPPPPQEPPPESASDMDLLNEYIDQLAQLDTIGDAAAWNKQAQADANLSPESKRKIHDATEIQCAVIRGKRGQRSNGGQKSMIDTQAAATESGE